MRYIALGSRDRVRLQTTIEARDKDEARKGAEVWAAHYRLRVTEVFPEYAGVVVADGKVQFLSSIFDGTYTPIADDGTVADA